LVAIVTKTRARNHPQGGIMKILLPVDGSKSAINACKYVAKLSADLKSKCVVTLINVHDDVGLNHVKQFVAKSVVDDYLREISEKELKPAQKALDAAGIKYTIVIKDMIVMGSKGRSGFIDMIMGSIAQKIVSGAKQPVVLIK
jgi:nucleotide-binding universal stress UspA family protein